MALLLLEGFELFADAEAFANYGELQSKLGCAKQEAVATALLTNGSVTVTDTDSRITGGRSLHVSRATGGLDATHWVRLGFDIAPRPRCCVGFGFKSSAAPEAAFPLVAFYALTPTGNAEQLSLWITPSGGVFCSSDAAVADETGQAGPTPIAAGTGSSAEVTHGEWNYIEVDLNLSTATPQLLVKVNGVPVIDFAESASFQKQAQSIINNVSILAPAGNYFASLPVSFYIDDIYINVANAGAGALALGPQQIVQLSTANGATTTMFDAVPPSTFGGFGNGATQTELNSEDTFPMNSVPSEFPIITGLCVSAILTTVNGSVNATVGVRDDAAGAKQTFGALVGIGSATSTCLRMTTDDPPGDLALTPDGLADLHVHIELDNFGG